jgi:hypothetical protein
VSHCPSLRIFYSSYCTEILPVNYTVSRKACGKKKPLPPDYNQSNSKKRLGEYSRALLSFSPLDCTLHTSGVKGFNAKLSGFAGINGP